MAKAKIITFDLSICAEDVLEQLQRSKLIVMLKNSDDTKAYVAGRGVNKAALKKAMKAEEDK